MKITNPASLTIEGLILMAVAYLVKTFGLPFTEVEMSQLVEGIVIAIGFVMAWYGRVRIKGESEVNAFGLKVG
jgi:hypothetical protein